METDKKYNGWTNYETWLVALHIDNDEGLQEEIKRLIQEKYKYEFERAEAIKNLRAEAIKNFFEELLIPEDSKELLKNDLLNATLREVNWKEIVESFEEERKVGKA